MSDWYHIIDLPNEVTPGRKEYIPIWNNIASTMSQLEYDDATVLDVGTWDGKWAFEAERLGASHVRAIDKTTRGQVNFNYAKKKLNSKAEPMFGISLEEYVHNRRCNITDNLFDIVQHFGVLYHCTDPLASLKAASNVLVLEGHLILETVCCMDKSNAYMLFSGGSADNHFYGPTDYWCPSTLCLYEMLSTCGFELALGFHSGIIHSCNMELFGKLKELHRICVIVEKVR